MTLVYSLRDCVYLPSLLLFPSQNDVTLQAVIRAINTGNWIEESNEISVDQAVFQSMSKLKEELLL